MTSGTITADVETSKLTRDKLLFFIILAAIIHFFAIANVNLDLMLLSVNEPLEVVAIVSNSQEGHPKRVNYLPEESGERNLQTDLEDENQDSTRVFKPTAKQLIARSLAAARNNQELQEQVNIRGDRPRRKYISANTKDHRYAAYMEAWRAKVERIGNINYPHQARLKRLSGDLLLDVAISQDGSVQQITIRRSAGNKILDAAAINIVELAAPFAPLPEEIAKEVDILHITRTWKFVDDSDFTAR